ncbi:hypothetical protein LY28_03747 [Ruminiclostridium sufflavum DSM 19573]|uniref:Uncharacterized protein n=1 Tax=Ruminiclostridium sufflavum DSM 19573 TaxID=1121337 RepID=A0A318XJ94_9FIRM|nr:hypothetical protein [Ruminiclostridium sufflavum]PYG84242.1 hypothetical protein LY28_03747 [Ruminiclostridium sufflavum DSM 19573]
MIGIFKWIEKKKLQTVIITILISGMILAGCTERQSDVVSYNLSLEADNFNVARKLTVINQRTDTILFQMTGNFSIEKETDGDLAVIGEDDDGRYYKHFVYLSSEISYIVEDIGKTEVNKHKYQINFNPRMIIPVEATTID